MSNIERLGTFSVGEVLDKVRASGVLDDVRRNVKVKGQFKGYSTKLSSKRLMVFCLTGVRCVTCGISGEFFALEKHSKDHNPHLNLYAINSAGEEVLMTKDHIVPKSKKGSDGLSNLQTMCAPCNLAKGNS